MVTQRCALRRGAAHEQLIGFDGVHQAAGAGGADLRRGGISMAGIGEPDIAFEHGLKLRGKEAALRLEMARRVAAVARDIGQRRIEEHDRFRAHGPVLDEAEA